MTFTGGYAITTAATNVFNAIVTAVLMWKMMRFTKPKQRRNLWGAVFGLFFLSCVYGAATHGISMSLAQYRYYWNYLYAVLSFLLAFFVAAVVYETDGVENAKKTGAVTFVLAACFTAARFFFQKYISFREFSIFAFPLLIYALIKLAAGRKQKPYLTNFIIAIVCLLIGSALQTVKSIRFYFFFDFNYDSVYHLFTLLLVVFIYRGLKEQASLPEQ